MNDYFQHNEINTCTWTQHTRNLRSVSDYLMKQKSNIKIRGVRVFRGTECGSYHLIITKMILAPNRKCIHPQNENNFVDVDQLQYNLSS